MLGKTNCKSAGQDASEFVNISLLSNQSSHDDLVGAKVTLKYGTFVGEYTWSGNALTVSVPAYVQYTVQFSDVEGYKTPSSVTYTAVEDNARDIEAVYQCELLTVNVSADEGTVNGYEITILKQETVGVATKYTKLEYIESTGTQYIDTGFKPNQNTRMILNVAFLSSSGTNVAGVRNSDSDTINRFGIITFSSSSKIGAFFRNSSIEAIACDTSKHIYDLSKSKLFVDDIGYGSSNSNTFTCTYPITLGAWNNGSGGISYNNSKIYRCRIYDNGTLIRDYIPALRSDGVAGLYDAVNDTFSVSKGSSNFVAGAKVGDVIATQTAATGTYKIPYGVSYSVSASDINGFTTPVLESFTASAQSRVVDMVYEKIKHAGTTSPSNGVYIQDTDGYFHTESEWTGEYTPNGVAVITSNCRFVMALKDAYSFTCQWGSYGKTVSNIATSTNESTAVQDYAGESNTTTIISALNGYSDGGVMGAPAAEYCRNYTFPNGQKGYLGAAGEWQAALDNKAAVESALNKCGGTAMFSYYWTSTQYSSDGSWYMRWYIEYFDYDGKDNFQYVRAFAAI